MKFKSKYTGTQIENKLDNVEAKFTATEKTKLANLENYDDSEIKADVEAVQTGLDTVNQNISELQETTEQNQSDISALQSDTANNKTNISDLQSDVAINKTALGIERKNLLKNTATTITRAGITYTVNNDGSVTLTGVNAAVPSYNFFSIPFTLKAGKYKVNGMPESSASDTYRVDIRASESGGTVYGYGITEFEVEFAETTTAYYMIRIDGAYTENMNGITFYPMVRHADITDDTYEPYQPSLQEQITAISDCIADTGWVDIDNPDATTYSSWKCAYRRIGALVSLHIFIQLAVDKSFNQKGSYNLFTLPKSVIPKNANTDASRRAIVYIYLSNTSREIVPLLINDVGMVDVSCSSSNTSLSAGNSIYGDIMYMI